MNVFTFTEKMTRGQYPVNVSTSLALESIMGIHPDRQTDTPEHHRFDHYWLNLRTLYRNILGSFSPEMQMLMNPEAMSELLHDEYEAVKRILSDTKLTPTLYLCNYKDVYRRYKNHTVFKTDKTAKQVADRTLMEKSIQQFIDDLGKDTSYMLQFDTDIKPEKKEGKTVIQTHLCIDLLSYKHFEDLELIESHTGAIKNRSLWYTKYNNGKDLSMIPFTQYFLRVFGDREFFSPMDGKLRSAIVDLGTRYQWNALTTDMRIRLNLDQMKDKYYAAVVKDMM